MASSCHPEVAGSNRNTYTDPDSQTGSLSHASSSPGAPIKATSPLTATDQPKPSLAAASDAVSLASSNQEVPSNRKTYAAPAESPPSSSNGVLTIATDPSMATSYPKWSKKAASEAVNSCLRFQSVPSNWKTYAAPISTMPANQAPTRRVLPLTETAFPKALESELLSLSLASSTSPVPFHR